MPAYNLVENNTCTDGGVFLSTSPNLGHPYTVAAQWMDTVTGNNNKTGCAAH